MEAARDPIEKCWPDDDGQEASIKKSLDALAQDSLIHNHAIGHVLFIGDTGIGKRYMAQGFAYKYSKSPRAPMWWTDLSRLRTYSDLQKLFGEMSAGQFVWLGYLSKIPEPLVRPMAEALESRRFTGCAGVSTESECPKLLRERFSLAVRMKPYSEQELGTIADRQATHNGFKLDVGAAEVVATLAYGNPGIAVRLIGELKRWGKNPVFADDVRDLFAERIEAQARARPAPTAAAAEPKMDKSGRARGFGKIIGQTDTIARFKTFAELYRSKGSPVGHIRLVGEEGMGRGSLARAFAEEYGVNLRESRASQIERANDLASLIVDLHQGDVLLLSDIDGLRAPVAEVLVGGLRNFTLDIVVGKGSGARRMPLAVMPFTCIGTLRRERDCPPELRKWFPLILPLQPYSQSEMERLVGKLAFAKGLSLAGSARTLIARLSKGQPSQIAVLVHRLAIKGPRSIDEPEAAETLSIFGFGSGVATSVQTSSELGALSGIDFERLITTLLQQMGFTAEMTKASGDGGIDIEAVLDRPIVGGRYLIQCKRLAPDTLVSSPIVREFYGALIADRKAVKGILITTSGFTIQAQEFARNLPLELIEGSKLKSLLDEYLKPDQDKSAI